MSRLSVWLIPFQPCFMCSVNVPCQNPGLVTSTYCRISRRRLWIGLCCRHSPAPWATNPWWHFLSCSPRPSSLPPPPVWARWSWKNPWFLRGGWGGWKKGLMSCYVSGIRFSGKRSKSPGKCCKSCFKFEGNNFKGNNVPGGCATAPGLIESMIAWSFTHLMPFLLTTLVLIYHSHESPPGRRCCKLAFTLRQLLNLYMQFLCVPIKQTEHYVMYSVQIQVVPKKLKNKNLNCKSQPLKLE